MLKAASSVGRIRSALNEAVALDPAWFAARSAAVEFYLAAPALAGGSVSKAQELARTAPTPEQARALQARLLLHEDKPEAALPLLAQARSTTDSALAADLRSWTVSAGAQLINNGQGEKARALFEQMQREQPQNAMAPYFLARVHSDAGQHEQALKLLEAAATLAGAQRLPIDYRAGISLQALGNKEAARQALNRYVSAGKGSKKSMEDARKRLEQLAG
jgi:tetratricopeptide (TPR) repeat protein